MDKWRQKKKKKGNASMQPSYQIVYVMSVLLSDLIFN